MGKWHKGRIRRFFREGKKKVDLQLKQLADSGRPLDISLTNDFAFKKTFRNKDCADRAFKQSAGHSGR